MKSGSQWVTLAVGIGLGVAGSALFGGTANTLQARTNDRFDPFRCGLDHLSFSVATKAELEAAVQAFEELGVEHSDVTDLPPFGIAVLPFKDPDGVALELTAPL